MATPRSRAGHVSNVPRKTRSPTKHPGYGKQRSGPPMRSRVSPGHGRGGPAASGASRSATTPPTLCAGPLERRRRRSPAPTSAAKARRARPARSRRPPPSSRRALRRATGLATTSSTTLPPPASGSGGSGRTRSPTGSGSATSRSCRRGRPRGPVRHNTLPGVRQPGPEPERRGDQPGGQVGGAAQPTELCARRTNRPRAAAVEPAPRCPLHGQAREGIRLSVTRTPAKPKPHARATMQTRTSMPPRSSVTLHRVGRNIPSHPVDRHGAHRDGSLT